jgi:hypothetical protein
MAKTKEQLLNEQKTIKEIEQMPTRLAMDKLMSLQQILQTSIPLDVSFGEEQKYTCIWNDNELEILKYKILGIVRDM